MWRAGRGPRGQSLPGVRHHPGAQPDQPPQEWKQVRQTQSHHPPPAPSHLSISSSRRWLIRRTLEDFQSLDRQLHTCVYDRRYSQLPVIHQLENIANNDKVSQSSPQLIVFPKLLHSKEFLCHTKRERERERER